MRLLTKLRNLFTEYLTWVKGILLRVQLWAETPTGGGDKDAGN